MATIKHLGYSNACFIIYDRKEVKKYTPNEEEEGSKTMNNKCIERIEFSTHEENEFHYIFENGTVLKTPFDLYEYEGLTQEHLTNKVSWLLINYIIENITVVYKEKKE